MTLPEEFATFEGICLSQQEQVDFYQTETCKPLAHIYRKMGTFWVILQSNSNQNEFSSTVLGGPNPWDREENKKKHLDDKERTFTSAQDCADALRKEIAAFWEPMQKN